MGVCLDGRRAIFMRWHEWHVCLCVATAFGWQPAGTQLPPERGGGMTGYSSNDYQTVSETDAKAIASALEAALKSIVARRSLSKDQLEAIKEADIEDIVMLMAFANEGSFIIT